MDILKRLPREVQIILAATLLFLIFSFFDWQQVSVAGFTAGISMWHGIGVVTGLLIFAVLIWEAARVLNVGFGELPVGLVSVVLALLLFVFTLITFLTHDEARHWPAWIGFILSIVIAVVALGRARGEGVQIPDMSAIGSRMSAPQTSAGGSAPPPPSDTTSSSAEPPASTEESSSS
jgi:hypothetical protein